MQEGNNKLLFLHVATRTIKQISFRMEKSLSGPSSSVTPLSDEDNTSAKTAGWIVLFVFVVVGLACIWMFYPEYRLKQILKTGIPAEAVITDIHPTGSTYNDQPQVELTLRVASSTDGSFVTKSIMIINPVYLPQFQPGRLVKIKYDRRDHGRAAIEETQSF